VNQVKENRYIFIYGGANNTWVQNFTHELSKIKMNENIQRADIIIENYELGKGKGELNNSVPSFWIGVSHQEAVDCEIQKIVKCLFCLKRDPQGWAILSKGHNIKHLCHGQAVYQIVAEFQNWKERVFDREGFDIAFKEYYIWCQGERDISRVAVSWRCLLLSISVVIVMMLWTVEFECLIVQVEGRRSICLSLLLLSFLICLLCIVWYDI